MRNMLKATTLERKFPLLAVENGCIISKDADITVAFRVELPELFTVTSAEYEAIHSAWYKAIKVLPDYSIVHKQDFFITENYQPDTGKDELSFLSRSFERHFNERPFLNHYCYLFLTKTTRERSRRQSDFSTLCRGRIVPQEIADRETAMKFIEAVGQFERIMNDSGFITLTRLAVPEITGQDGKAGIIEKYFSLSQTDTTCLKDIGLYPEEMRVGDDILCLHTLSDVEDLPEKVGTDTRFEKLSTDRSDCRLSFAAPVGVLLSCNHVYNQYIFIDDHAENLKTFEQTARNMQSLSRYSRANQINKEWIDEYLNEAHSKGLVSVRCHCNVMAWSDDREELKRIRNDVGSQLALMECKPRHNTVDTPTLFWAGIPGNEGDFPAEESFYTFLGQALCLFVEETNHVLGAGSLPVRGGNQLQEFAFPVRHQDGGQGERATAAHRHIRPAHEEGHHDQPQQVHTWAERVGKVLLHQPHGTPVLRAGCARAAGRYGKQLLGAVPAYSQPHTRRGRDLFHVHQREPDSVQPLLCRGRGV